MDELCSYNRHYLAVDERGRILDGWSDGPCPGRETAGAVLLTDRGGYQFRLHDGGEENPQLMSREGVPLYAWDGDKVTARSAEEIAADVAALPKPGPTASQRLEAQVTYTAMMTDTLLSEAQEGTL